MCIFLKFKCVFFVLFEFRFNKMNDVDYRHRCVVFYYYMNGGRRSTK